VRSHVILQRKLVDHDFVAHRALEGPLLDRSVGFPVAQHVPDAGQWLLTDIADGGLEGNH
jgi:hypothetical protein